MLVFAFVPVLVSVATVGSFFATSELCRQSQHCTTNMVSTQITKYWYIICYMIYDMMIELKVNHSKKNKQDTTAL